MGGARARPASLSLTLRPQRSGLAPRPPLQVQPLHIRRLQYDLDVRTVRPVAVRPLHNARGREAL